MTSNAKKRTKTARTNGVEHHQRVVNNWPMKTKGKTRINMFLNPVGRKK